MVSVTRYHQKPLFWIAALGVAAVAAYSTLQQVTFVPGVPARGVVQAYAILFAFWFVAILAAWFFLQLIWFWVRRARGDM